MGRVRPFGLWVTHMSEDAHRQVKLSSCSPDSSRQAGVCVEVEGVGTDVGCRQPELDSMFLYCYARSSRQPKRAVRCNW